MLSQKYMFGVSYKREVLTTIVLECKITINELPEI